MTPICFECATLSVHKKKLDDRPNTMKPTEIIHNILISAFFVCEYALERFQLRQTAVQTPAPEFIHAIDHHVILNNASKKKTKS